MARRIRVLRVVNLVSRSGRYGGPSDSSHRQAEIVARRLPATFAAGYFADDMPLIPSSGALETMLFQVHSLVPSFPFPSAISWRGVRSLWRAVRRSDVVHVSIAREIMPITAALLALLTRTPLIVQPHGMLTSRAGRLQTLLDLVVKPLVKRARAVVALTEDEAKALLGWLGSAPPNVEILHNPLVARLPEILDPPRVHEALSLGRLHKRKRLDVVVAAAATAKANGWLDDYVVVGPDEGELPLVKASISRGEIRAYEPGLPLAEVATRVARCSVFVLTSESEPWGNVLALALALGKPVVIPRSAAIAPLVEEYAAGVLVPDSAADAVAHAVHGLLTDAARREEVVAGARRLAAERLSDDYQLQRLSQLYTSVVSTLPEGFRS